jgi:DNA-binding MarR family transcriptional regulator
MAEELRVTPVTVARAVKSLKEQGLLLVRPTKSDDCRYAEYSVDFGGIQELLKAKRRGAAREAL